MNPLDAHAHKFQRRMNRGVPVKSGICSDCEKPASYDCEHCETELCQSCLKARNSTQGFPNTLPNWNL